jgi:hypothetical protein
VRHQVLTLAAAKGGAARELTRSGNIVVALSRLVAGESDKRDGEALQAIPEQDSDEPPRFIVGPGVEARRCAPPRSGSFM